MSEHSPNLYLTRPLGPLYARTAIPIIFVMATNGAQTVIDALFLGHYVGPEALAAVTLVFPAYMLIVALASLVSSGMSSILARHLGAGRFADATRVFAGAHSLALTLCLVLISAFVLWGQSIIDAAALGNDSLSEMAMTYLRIIIFSTPLQFIVAVNSDALRNEGKVPFMTAVGLLTSLVNIAFNYWLIVLFDWGVAGSAFGTVLAQAASFLALICYRLSGRALLDPMAALQRGGTRVWSEILALGAPQSLSYIGLSIGASSVVVALQWVGTPNYEATVSAYGIITRIMTFAFLPLLGLMFAMQSITGNNFGAGNWGRTTRSLGIALAVSLAYGVVIQAVCMLWAREIGAMFVSDAGVIGEVALILPVVVALMFLAGPLLLFAMHFQAIGNAGRAALLGLSKPYLFAIPLTFGLAMSHGEIGIWIASPAAEFLLLGLTLTIIWRDRRTRSLQEMLLGQVKEVRS